MKYIQCPEEFFPSEPKRLQFNIFLAGGITGCLDWQSWVIDNWEKSETFKTLDGMGELTIINPRRSNFDTSKTRDSIVQIEWEHRHLALSTGKYFWFPKEGQCMITLFELGKHINDTIFVGVEPGYIREHDVQEQLRLSRPDVKIHSSLEELFDMETV